ncbi:MAG TPA: TetR family transcriptional regulator [Candidatus Enterocloster faecavium]|uniref:TetR family transcriptional regulator n=1 Tax=Candidatus Enterocloster faecavium TaxID=2838560 RepID=A0A9D2RJJ9_9FIRM|nr:TetR family transcriptional regulator [Candidatus Enterocloster faecavium]
MPTQRFFNLKEEKRRAILDAAFHEFSRTSYANASINQIIKEADISRGSFYTYFEDKDDLMRYLVRDFKESCKERILKVLDQCQGDPFETVCRLLKELMEGRQPENAYALYKNSLMDMNVVHQNQLLGMERSGTGGEEQRQFIHELLAHIDQKQFPLGDEEKAACLIEMMFVIGVKAVTTYYMGAAEEGEILRSARNQMNILKNGAFA